MLTGGKNCHKIKLAETGQLAVGIAPKMLTALTTFVLGGRGEKKGTGVKWAGHYY